MLRSDAGLDVVDLARRVLRDNGFDPELPPELEREIPPHDLVDGLRDLRDLRELRCRRSTTIARLSSRSDATSPIAAR